MHQHDFTIALEADQLGAGDVVRITDIMILVAECVDYCQSCRNLSDCSACDTGKVLDMLTRECYD